MTMMQRSADADRPLRRALLPAAIFLDRDGTINVERADYVKSVDELVLLAGVVRAISELSGFDIPIILITNQSAIGRGIVTPEQIDDIHAFLLAQVQAAQGRIDAVYLCPHRPEDGCACRKPQPGLLLAAAADFQLELDRCIFIGDSVTDLEAARAAGCQPLMVCSGRQAQSIARLAALDPTVPVVADLPAAVAWIQQRLSAGQSVCDAVAHHSVVAGSHWG